VRQLGRPFSFISGMKTIAGSSCSLEGKTIGLISLFLPVVMMLSELCLREDEVTFCVATFPFGHLEKVQKKAC